jgi:hypothetical protein
MIEKYIKPNTSDGLNCIAHPLQISTDPTKCLIKGDVWINGGVQVIQNSINATNQPVAPNPLTATAQNFIADIPNTQTFIVRGFVDTPSSYLIDFILRNKPKTIPITKEALVKEFQILRTQIENGIESIDKAADNTTTLYNFFADAGGGNTLSSGSAPNTAITTNNSELRI